MRGADAQVCEKNIQVVFSRHLAGLCFECFYQVWQSALLVKCTVTDVDVDQYPIGGSTDAGDEASNSSEALAKVYGVFTTSTPDKRLARANSDESVARLSIVIEKDIETLNHLQLAIVSDSRVSGGQIRHELTKGQGLDQRNGDLVDLSLVVRIVLALGLVLDVDEVSVVLDGESLPRYQNGFEVGNHIAMVSRELCRLIKHETDDLGKLRATNLGHDVGWYKNIWLVFLGDGDESARRFYLLISYMYRTRSDLGVKVT